MKLFTTIMSILLLLPISLVSYGQTKLNKQEKATINELVTQYHFNRQKLLALFNQSTVREDIIKKMNKPYEAKPWFQYRRFFVTNQRAKKGVVYWKQHQKTLAHVAKQYGIPASIIVAIIGIETNYGHNTGREPTFDVLRTLAFHYHRRQAFFKSEFIQFLLLTRDEDMNPMSIKGSYAGALGIPQFMPSNYRTLAVDFNNTGDRNLLTNHNDAIGSIANYLHTKHWWLNKPITVRAIVTGEKYKRFLHFKIKPKYTIATLMKNGIKPIRAYKKAVKAALIELKDRHGPEFWLGLHNFYVLSRYNPSSRYTMAVYQLSERIQALRRRA